MWRSLWRSFDRFSVQHFKYVINELREIEVVDGHNWELVVDLLQSIVEIVTYGDKQDPKIFECFMEQQVLAEFLRMLKISTDSRIEAPLLQYLSIMIQNMDTEHAVYYCFSNNYVNSIIAHHYTFDGGDLAQFYVAFLRAVSTKMNRDILCLLVNVHKDAVISFPLYTEAIKFSKHEEKMVQIAVRALILNIYNVGDDMVYQFVTTPPVSKYFSDLVHSLKGKCIHLDTLVHATEETCNKQRRKEIVSETDKIVDDLYYLKDILRVGETRLSAVVLQNVLDLLVFPILLPLRQIRQSDGPNLSAITSLFIASRLLQVLDEKDVSSLLAQAILCTCMSASERGLEEVGFYNSFLNSLNDVERLLCKGFMSEVPEGIDGSTSLRNYSQCLSSSSHSEKCPMDDSVSPERMGILKFIFSGNHTILLGSLFLLLTLSESQDRLIIDGGILTKFSSQIMNALLKVLASQLATSSLIKLHAGWFMQKILSRQVMKLDEHNLHLLNASYKMSFECFKKELEGCWFDHIREALVNEWASCKIALEEPSQSKDPFFLLDSVISKKNLDGDVSSSSVAWHRMVDALKVFILHLQLKVFICKGELVEKHLEDSRSSYIPVNFARTAVSNLSSANFGSEVSLASGVACRIAFLNAGIRDIYIIPTTKGTSGRLLLVEKHPFRSQRGLVIATAPLAGLNPKIDEDHPTRLQLRIREFDPRLNTSKTRGDHLKEFNHVADGRWTLGFANARACDAARLMIIDETNKLRCSVKSSVSLLLRNYDVGDSWDGQAE